MPQATTNPLVAKFHSLSSTLNSELVERYDQIEAMLVALIAGLNFFSLGAPGVAKSMANDRLIVYIDGVKLWKRTVTRQDSLPDLFGMLDLPALDQGRYVYATDGFLPWCDIARIGEIFKTSTTNLNAMLEAFNERQWTNGADHIDIPLSSVFCDSNEMPPDDSDELAAIWDRLHVRVKVEETSDQGLRALLDMPPPDPHPTPILAWGDVEKAKDEAGRLGLSDDAKNALILIRRALRDASITPSPRRFMDSRKGIQAYAWMQGAAEVDVEHLAVLVHMMWERPEQIKQVEQIILSIVAPNMGEALIVADEAGELAEQGALILAEKDKTVRAQALMDLAGKLKVAKAKADKLHKSSAGRALRVVEDTQRQIEALKARIADEIGF